jgi:hypothetical protein
LEHHGANSDSFSRDIGDLKCYGVFNVFITDTSLQLPNPITLAKETSSLINSKEQMMKLLTLGNEKQQAIKLLIRNFLVYQGNSS